MTSIGDIVNASVIAVEAHGIRLSYVQETILVLIPEVSWLSDVRDCREFAFVGQHFDVKIIRYVREQDLYLGSLKAAQPELDPWVNADWLRAGEVRSAVVDFPMVNDGKTVGYYVTLAIGITGLLRVTDQQRPFAKGDTVLVRIAAVEPESRKVEVVCLSGRRNADQQDGGSTG
jgi:ribosomal protein S1